jgi:hypothetical protein
MSLQESAASVAVATIVAGLVVEDVEIPTPYRDALENHAAAEGLFLP